MRGQGTSGQHQRTLAVVAVVVVLVPGAEAAAVGGQAALPAWLIRVARGTAEEKSQRPAFLVAEARESLP